jgi:hypothetical protein
MREERGMQQAGLVSFEVCRMQEVRATLARPTERGYRYTNHWNGGSHQEGEHTHESTVDTKKAEMLRVPKLGQCQFYLTKGRQLVCNADVLCEQLSRLSGGS